MIYLQVQQQDTNTGKHEILFSIETEENHRDFMINELHLIYDERATETKHINVVEVNKS